MQLQFFLTHRAATQFRCIRGDVKLFTLVQVIALLGLDECTLTACFEDFMNSKLLLQTLQQITRCMLLPIKPTLQLTYHSGHEGRSN